MKKTIENAVRVLRQLVIRYEFIHNEDGPARQSRKCLLQQWRNIPEDFQKLANATLSNEGVEIPDGMPWSMYTEKQLLVEEDPS